MRTPSDRLCVARRSPAPPRDAPPRMEHSPAIPQFHLGTHKSSFATPPPSRRARPCLASPRPGSAREGAHRSPRRREPSRQLLSNIGRSLCETAGGVGGAFARPAPACGARGSRPSGTAPSAAGRSVRTRTETSSSCRPRPRRAGQIDGSSSTRTGRRTLHQWTLNGGRGFMGDATRATRPSPRSLRVRRVRAAPSASASPSWTRKTRRTDCAGSPAPHRRGRHRRSGSAPRCSSWPRGPTLR
jgi:hypothetical protein